MHVLVSLLQIMLINCNTIQKIFKYEHIMYRVYYRLHLSEFRTLLLHLFFVYFLKVCLAGCKYNDNKVEFVQQ